MPLQYCSRGLRPCQRPKLTFNEHLWVASPAYSHCSSRNNPYLVVHGSGRVGVQCMLIGGRSALVGVGSQAELDHSLSLISRGQSVITAGMIGMIFCTCSRQAAFPIHRINLQWARTNSRSLRLTRPSWIGVNLWTRSKITPDLPELTTPLPLSLRSLPFNSRLFPIGPDFQIDLDRERIIAQWNGGISHISHFRQCVFIYLNVL